MTSIRRCPNCGSEYPEKANYCPKCDMFVGTSSYIHEAPNASEYAKIRKHQKESDELIRQKLLEKHRHEENKLRAAKEAATKKIHKEDEWLASTLTDKPLQQEPQSKKEASDVLEHLEIPREVLIEKTIEEVLPEEKQIKQVTESTADPAEVSVVQEIVANPINISNETSKLNPVADTETKNSENSTLDTSEEEATATRPATDEAVESSVEETKEVAETKAISETADTTESKLDEESEEEIVVVNETEAVEAAEPFVEEAKESVEEPTVETRESNEKASVEQSSETTEESSGASEVAETKAISETTDTTASKLDEDPEKEVVVVNETEAVEAVETPVEEIEKVAEESTVETSGLKAEANKTVIATKAITKAPISENHDTVPRKKRPVNKVLMKKMWVAVAVIVVAGSGIGYTYYYDLKESEKLELIAKENAEKIATLNKDIANLYTDDSQQFVKASVSQTTVAELAKRLEQLSEKTEVDEIRASLDLVEEKLLRVTDLNALFESDVLSEKTIDENAMLKADVSTIDLTKIQTADAFANVYNEGLQLAHDQLAVNQKARSAVAKVIAEDALTKDATRDLYQETQKVVAALNNKALKTELEASLKTANTLLVAKEKAAEAAAVAQKEQQTADNLAQAVDIFGQERVNQWVEKLPTKQTGSLSNLDEGSMSSDPWQWAPGVQAAVLNECFRRGYIVDGGYSLEKMSVENGEGYYGLYATNNQSPLTKKMGEVKTPVYLLKINCKTGWFRGTGVDATSN